MRKVVFLSLIFTTLLNSIAWSWGGKGHDIIVAIAQNHLTPKAQKAVSRALDGRSMVYYASWMDNVRTLPQYQFTKTWHYANVDEGQSYATMDKDENGDVCVAVSEIVAKLSNERAKMDDSTESFYVKALIHFMGDMHCPMHAGRRTDLGGNKFTVKWFNSPTNLHSVWDSKLIESARSWSYSEWVDNLDYENADATMLRHANGTPPEWFNETVDLGKGIYLSATENANYSYDYIRDNSPMAEQQLLKAGYRLASLLNRIYK